MSVRLSDAAHDMWQADIHFPYVAHYIKYYFRIVDTQGRVHFYTTQGTSEGQPVSGFFELLQVNPSDVIHVPQWSQGLIYYQIFPERFAAADGRERHTQWREAQPEREGYFGGDLEGIRKKMPYLKELGVEALYLTPVFYADFNHKYATIDYFRVDSAFGTNDDVKTLVEQAHKLGIKVLLDGVFNHCGTNFEPFQDLLKKGELSPYRDWFFPQSFPVSIEEMNYECVGDYRYMPRLNTTNAEVRDYLLQVMLFWIDYAAIDGWRLDVADEVDCDTWRYLRSCVKRKHPNVLLLGETWGDASKWVLHGDQLDCAMNYLFRDAMVDFFAARTIDALQLSQRLQNMLMKYPWQVNQAMYNLIGSHDTPRFMTLCNNDESMVKLAFAVMMLFPGSPAIYYGDELGMRGENDPGCRGGMRWDLQQSSLHAWVKELAYIRKENEAVRKGDYRTLHAEGNLFVFERRIEQSRIVVCINRGEKAEDFTDGSVNVCVQPKAVEIIYN